MAQILEAVVCAIAIASQVVLVGHTLAVLIREIFKSFKRGD